MENAPLINSEKNSNQVQMVSYINSEKKTNQVTVSYRDSRINAMRKQSAAPPCEPSLPGKLLAAGTAACIADLITFPLDTAKARLQIQGENTTGSSRSVAGMAKQPKLIGVVGTVCTISRTEGPKALYNGLIPGLHRQMCFASIRIGLYDTIRQQYTNLLGQGQANVGIRILAGVTTGGMAVLCAQPTDVVKVRFQCALPGVPRRYTGVMAAYRTIAVEEGIRGLWKGTSPNMARNAIVNATELVSYDLIKTKILSMGLLSDNMPCHFVSAFGAGFCTTCIASPVDVVKTRFMNSGAGTYSGVLNCAASMYKREGLPAFYKGFMPSFMRMASWNVVMFVCYEQLKRTFASAPKIPTIELERRGPKRFV